MPIEVRQPRRLSARIAARSARARFWPVPLIAVLCGGCSSAATSSGYSVSGTVNWKGQPLDQGTIQFTPENGTDSMVGTEISGGQFVLPNPPGLTPGDYRVRISARSGPGGLRDANLTDPTSREQIPPEYNEQTTLKAQVTPHGSWTFTFDLVDSGKRAAPRVAPRQGPGRRALRR